MTEETEYFKPLNLSRIFEPICWWRGHRFVDYIPLVDGKIQRCIRCSIEKGIKYDAEERRKRGEHSFLQEEFVRETGTEGDDS